MASARRWWKVVGLAGAVGIAAGGALVARNERVRQAYTPDEVRARLHDRHAAAARAVDDPATRGGDPPHPGA